MEAFEQTLSLQKDGDGGFVKIPVIGTVTYNFIKGNKIHQPNVEIWLKLFSHLAKPVLYKMVASGQRERRLKVM